jgi:hypothetical protein
MNALRVKGNKLIGWLGRVGDRGLPHRLCGAAMGNIRRG